MSDLVLIEREGSAAVVTLNQGARRNVLSAALVDALGAAYDALEADPSVNVVVLTGAAPAFCAGAELPVLRAAAEKDFNVVRKVYDGFLRVLRSPLPTIGAINGPAVGAGFNLALACDVRLAARSATFDTRFATLRLHPGGGHAWLLARAVGEQQAMLATAFGQVWDADRAREAGLVASIHDDATLVADAVAIARRMDGQESAFTRRLVGTLRRALGTTTHDEALAALDVIGVGFVSAREPFDTTTPSGKRMLHLVAAFAEFVRAVLIERVRDGLAVAKTRGRERSSVAPVLASTSTALANVGNVPLRKVTRELGWHRHALPCPRRRYGCRRQVGRRAPRAPQRDSESSQTDPRARGILIWTD